MKGFAGLLSTILVALSSPAMAQQVDNSLIGVMVDRLKYTIYDKFGVTIDGLVVIVLVTLIILSPVVWWVKREWAIRERKREILIHQEAERRLSNRRW